MSRLADYIYNKFLGFPEALPPHLANYQGTGKVKLHTDWPPLLRLIPRSWNARGARVRTDSEGYLRWPPVLVEGRDVTRWENTGATSILFLPDLIDETIKGSDVYGRTHKVIETNRGNKRFKEEFDLFFPHPMEAHVYDVLKKNGLYELCCSPNDYSPSALQKFSWGSGFVELKPYYKSKWKILDKREWPWETPGPDHLLKPDWEDVVAFMREGARPDHQDGYYNVDQGIKIPNVGLHWE